MEPESGNEMQSLKPTNDAEDVAIRMQTYDPKVKSEPVRWDILYLMWFTGAAVTAMVQNPFFLNLFYCIQRTQAFGGQHDFVYSDAAFFCIFIHFGGETAVSWHFLYSAKTAKILSIITWIVISAQAVSVFFVPRAWINTVFSVEFIMSDGLSFFACICVLLNKSSVYLTPIGAEFKKGVFALSLHFIGVGLRVYQTPAQLYDVYGLPAKGLGWALIAVVYGPQVYLSHRILCGDCNKLGAIEYDKEKQPFLKVFAQIVCPIVALIALPAGLYIMAGYRTTSVEDMGPGYKDDTFVHDEGIVADFVGYIMWPYGFAVLLYLFYVYTTKNTHSSV